MDEHPRRAESISEHREAVREEGLLHLHEDLATIGQQSVDALGIRDAVERQGQVGAADRLKPVGLVTASFAASANWRCAMARSRMR